MTEILQIRGFGKAGINTDLPIYDLPPESLSRGKNFRCSDTSVSAFGGSSRFKNAEDLPDTIIDPWHIHFADGDPDRWIIAGSQNIGVLDVGSWGWNISGNFSVPPWLWTATNLGRVPVLNNESYYPITVLPGETDAQVIQWDGLETWEDRNIHAKSIRSYKSFLIAMNITDGVQVQPDVVMWSDSADTGTLPGSWNYADPATLAGKNVLGGSEGDIIDGLPLRDSFIIYRKRGITTMDFAGGTDWVFNFRSFTNSIDIVGLNCIKEIKGVHFIMTADDIVVNDGNSINSILHNRMRKYFQSHINNERLNRCFIARDDDNKEIWFCYPEVGSDVSTQALLWNWRDNTWAVRDFPGVTHMDYGYAPPIGESWVDDDKPWGEEIQTWGNAGTSVTGRKNVGISSSLLTTFEEATEAYETLWERQSIPIAGHGVNVTVQRLLPQIVSQNTERKVYVQVGSQQFAEDTIKWKTPIRFYPSSQRKVDMRVTGELFSFKVYSTGIGTFSMSGMDIEYVVAGRR